MRFFKMGGLALLAGQSHLLTKHNSEEKKKNNNYFHFGSGRCLVKFTNRTAKNCINSLAAILASQREK